MKKLAALLILAATFSAQAATYEDYARVLSVQEKYASSGQPRQVCNGGSNSSGLGMGTVIGAVDAVEKPFFNLVSGKKMAQV